MGDAIVEAVSAPAHPALRRWVARYDGYRTVGAAPGRHQGLPSPYLTLIVTFDEPLHLAVPSGPAAVAGAFDVLVGGLHTRPATVVHDGRQAGIQVALHPRAAPVLLGVPAGELAHADLQAGEVIGRAALELHERVAAAPGWPARFAAVDRVLVGLGRQGMARHRRPVERDATAAADRAWQLLVARRGGAGVAELAAAAGWGERRLRDRFAELTGLTPKAAGRVVRFDGARRELAARASGGGPLDLAGLAASHGYADHGHLTREWVALAGCAPTQWLASEGIGGGGTGGSVLPEPSSCDAPPRGMVGT